MRRSAAVGRVIAGLIVCLGCNSVAGQSWDFEYSFDSVLEPAASTYVIEG